MSNSAPNFGKLGNRVFFFHAISTLFNVWCKIYNKFELIYHTGILLLSNCLSWIVHVFQVKTTPALSLNNKYKYVPFFFLLFFFLQIQQPRIYTHMHKNLSIRLKFHTQSIKSCLSVNTYNVQLIGQIVHVYNHIFITWLCKQ